MPGGVIDPRQIRWNRKTAQLVCGRLFLRNHAWFEPIHLCNMALLSLAGAVLGVFRAVSAYKAASRVGGDRP
jgi:hypothetical protein